MPEVQLKWDDTDSPESLEESLRTSDNETAAKLLDALRKDLDQSERAMDPRAAKKVLASLRKYAWFAQLGQIAGKIREYAQDDPQVINHWAQAQIELGEITSAIDSLIPLKNHLEEALSIETNVHTKSRLEWQLSETIGHLGRAYKQYYINAKPSKGEPRTHDLKEALRYYGEAYDRMLGDFRWHGINWVALHTHQVRVAAADRRAVSPNAQQRANKIFEFMEEKATQGPLQHWDLANYIETHLAQDDVKKATKAVESYLGAASDVFSVQSTRRQLVELWLLTDTEEPGNAILPMFDAWLAEQGGTPENIDLDPSKSIQYERIWGATAYQPLQWLRTALERAKIVARIGRSQHVGSGTGFLFDGAWISEKWANAPLLLTNAHVCSNDPEVQNTRPHPKGPENLEAAFLGNPDEERVAVRKFENVVWTSRPSELDATLLLMTEDMSKLRPPPRVASQPPTKKTERVNILGHPGGLDLRVSLQDNEVLGIGDTFVHYRTPTNPGSSGSPVFDQRWELVALHHGAAPSREANEGIRIDVILERMREEIG